VSTVPVYRFSVLTGVIRLNIIGEKLYNTILAIGERKRGSSFLKKESFFLSWNAKILCILRRDAFHLATIRRLG
jgi:hypothetical protein